MTEITETEPKVQVELAESELGALLAMLYGVRRDSNAIFLAATEPLYQKLRTHVQQLDPDFDSQWTRLLNLFERAL